jgi:hypothetical protein
MIIPFNASDEKKMQKIRLEQIKLIDEDRTNHVAFTDVELSKRTSKVTIHFALDTGDGDMSRSTVSTSPTRRSIFQSMSMPSSPLGSKGRTKSIISQGERILHAIHHPSTSRAPRLLRYSLLLSLQGGPRTGGTRPAIVMRRRRLLGCDKRHRAARGALPCARGELQGKAPLRRPFSLSSFHPSILSSPILSSFHPLIL